MKWKEETGTRLKQTREKHLQNKFPASIAIPFLPKSGHLESVLLIIAVDVVVYTM